MGEVLPPVEMAVGAVLQEAPAPAGRTVRVPLVTEVHVLTVEDGPRREPADRLVVAEDERVVVLFGERVRNRQGELPSEGQLTPARHYDAVLDREHRHHLTPVPLSSLEFHMSEKFTGSVIIHLCRLSDEKSLQRSFTL